MRELDRLDATHGLGSMPGTQPPQRRRGGSPFLAAFVVVGTLLVAIAALQPGSQLLTAARLLGIAPDVYGNPPEYARGEGEFAFMQTQRGSDEPVGYDPCEPITYAVNTAGAPHDWQDLVEAGVEHTEWATGLDFTYEGETDDRPFNPWQPISRAGRNEPVVIGWAGPEEFPGLAGHVAGLGGSVVRSEGLGRAYYDTGSIVLDMGLFGDHRVSRDELQAIVDHEFGHLVGLDHVDSTNELMHGSSTAHRTYGDGDREGLGRLGSIACR